MSDFVHSLVLRGPFLLPRGLVQDGTAAGRQRVLLLVVGFLAGAGGLGGKDVPEGGVGVGD